MIQIAERDKIKDSLIMQVQTCYFVEVIENEETQTKELNIKTKALFNNSEEIGNNQSLQENSLKGDNQLRQINSFKYFKNFQFQTRYEQDNIFEIQDVFEKVAQIETSLYQLFVQKVRSIDLKGILNNQDSNSQSNQSLISQNDQETINISDITSLNQNFETQKFESITPVKKDFINKSLAFTQNYNESKNNKLAQSISNSYQQASNFKSLKEQFQIQNSQENLILAVQLNEEHKSAQRQRSSQNQRKERVQINSSFNNSQLIDKSMQEKNLKTLNVSKKLLKIEDIQQPSFVQEDVIEDSYDYNSQYQQENQQLKQDEGIKNGELKGVFSFQSMDQVSLADSKQFQSYGQNNFQVNVYSHESGSFLNQNDQQTYSQNSQKKQDFSINLNPSSFLEGIDICNDQQQIDYSFDSEDFKKNQKVECQYLSKIISSDKENCNQYQNFAFNSVESKSRPTNKQRIEYENPFNDISNLAKQKIQQNTSQLRQQKKPRNYSNQIHGNINEE